MKYRALMLLLGMAMVAAACSSNGTEVLSETRVTTTLKQTDPPTTVPVPPADIKTDGVTVTNDTIYLGLLTDLTGPFSGNVLDIVDAQIAFWRDLNDEGGIAGRRIELIIADTKYEVDTHQDRYDDLRDRVLMFTHSTGAPHTVAIAADLVADDRLAIPGNWYSGWSDPTVGANVLETGSNYCLEAMNAISYVSGEHLAATGSSPSIAIATDPGDYGQDSAAGARYAAAQLGIPIAYEGEGAITGPASVTTVAAGIAGSGADWAWLTTDPVTAAQVVGAAVQLGYTGKWSGAMPTFSPRLLDTALGPYLSENWVLSALFSPLGAEVEGMSEVLAVMAESYPDRFPSDGVVPGFLEFSAARQVLELAAANGDLTPAGVVAAAAGIGELDFGGIGPVNRYTGDPNRDVSRATALYRPDQALFEAQGGLEATFGSGAVSAFSLIQDFAVSEIAAEYDFQGPCYRLEP